MNTADETGDLANSRVAAVIVTHNSGDVIDTCITKLEAQTHPLESLIIVDSGSMNTDYLQHYRNREGCVLLEKENIGFAQANNIGFSLVKNESDYILFINPDTFLSHDFIEKALDGLRTRKDVAVISGKLLGFDPAAMRETGRIDSTGIFRKIYGRWYDRGKGEADTGRYDDAEVVPALCGALMLCRKQALAEIADGDDIFDPDFFLYKEDIELSLRLRRGGWHLLYAPELVAYHCRGWGGRRHVAQGLKEISSRNEILLYKKHPSPYIIWAIIKYLLVKTLKV